MRNIFLIILTFVFTFSIAYAQTFYTDFFVTLKDINSEEIIISMPIELNWYRFDTGGTVNLTKYLDKRGTFSYRISPGKWRLYVYVDNRSTPEIDYFGESIYSITDELVTRGEIMYVIPVGSLELRVSDAPGNLVADADLDFKCKSYRESAKTDRFGSYKAENLPAGECKVSAAFGNLVGTATVDVIQGHEASKDITLSKPLRIKGFEGYFYYIIATVVILVVLFLIYLRVTRKRIKKQVKEEVAKSVKKRPAKKKKAAKASKKAEKEEEGLNPRARDIMKTLNEKEQRVVNFLLENKNKSTQATIRNETGIPKTTLARIFQALEAKKVIKIETIGKLKKIELTDWFLGKE